jgi:nucleotide-binding universal stress UspA family protein
MYRKILLAYDGSETGQKALLDAKEIAQLLKSEVALVAVMPPPAALIGGEGGVYDAKLEEEERKEYQAILEDGLARLKEAGSEATGELLVGDAVSEIADYARKTSAELIVVGHKHRERWVQRWWSGSLSKSLVEHAPCSVLVVITR